MKYEEIAQMLATMSGTRYIALIGKVGSGKTSIFNQLVGKTRSEPRPNEPMIGLCDLGHGNKVLLIDTAHLNTTSELKQKSMQRIHDILRRSDIAIYACDIRHFDRAAYAHDIQWLDENHVPHLLVFNKCDMSYAGDIANLKLEYPHALFLSALEKDALPVLRARLAQLIRQLDAADEPLIPKPFIHPGDYVALVIAHGDESILGHAQLMHLLLKRGARCLTVTDDQLTATLEELPQIRAVISYAHAFDSLNKLVPEHIPLISHSMLYARQKRCLEPLAQGAKAIHNLTEDSRVLIIENGRLSALQQDFALVKVPRALRALAGENLEILHHYGTEMPEDLSSYDMVIYSGASRLTGRTLQARIDAYQQAGVPVANFGTVCAELAGILDRDMEALR